MISLSDIKKIFVPKAFPTADQFWNTFGSFWHKSERLPIEQVLGLNDSLNNLEDKKADKSDLDNIIGGMLPKGEVANITDLPTIPFDANNPNGVKTGFSYIVTNSKDPESQLSYIYGADVVEENGVKVVHWENSKLTAYPKDAINQKITDTRINPYIHFEVTKTGLGATNTIVFSANPRIAIGGNGRKSIYLFDADDDFSILMGENGIAYVDMAVVNATPNNGSIGLVNIRVANWTSYPNLSNMLVLCRISANKLDDGIGIIGYYLLSQQAQGAIDYTNIVTSKLGRELTVQIAPFVPFTATNTGGTTNKIVFSGNPSIQIGADGKKRIRLFAANESFEFPMGTNDVAFVDMTTIDAIPQGGYIGLENIQVVNWTANPDLSGKVVLCRTYLYKIEAGIGIIGYYLTSANVVNLESRVKTLESDLILSNIKDYFPTLTYYRESDKISKFREISLKKDKDAIVVITGTSLSKGYSHCSVRNDASTRPPLLHTVDFGSRLYDKLVHNWVGQQSRRYDHEFFTLIGGNWTTTDVDNIWDDSPPAHNGFTKYSTAANAGISFIVPADAYRFNFIYRTDALGDICTIAIAEGDSKMEVLDESDNTWKEANGYQFSMFESPATDTKGNTVYQKRLNMRCKNRHQADGINSIGSEKHMTITKGNNTDKRFLLVGAEWSPREFMLMVINGARGSHNWGTGGLDNSKYQDSDIWVHKPNLLMAEITTINWGASTNAGAKTSPDYYLGLLKKWYFNDGNNEPKSIYAKTNGYTDCDVIFYNDTMTTQAFNADSSPIWGVTTLGVQKTCYENYDLIDEYMRREKSQYAFVALNPYFKSVSEYFLGSHYNGLVGSGVTGATLTSDNTHWNNNGAELVAKVILPLFDFV